MRYRLRTLLIVLALGPPLLWMCWHALTPAPEPAFYEYTEGVLTYPPRPPAGHHWELRQRERRYVAVPNEPQP